MLKKCDSRSLKKGGSAATLRRISIQKLIGFVATLVFFASSFAPSSSAETDDTIFPFKIKIVVDGIEAFETVNHPVQIPSSGSKVYLTIDPTTNLPDIQGPRIQYRLREVDTDWQEKQGWMAIGIRFLDTNRNSIKPISVEPKGKSAGWNGSPGASAFTPNQLHATIPKGAAFVSVFITSSGPPASVGTLVVKRLCLMTSDAEDAQMLIQEPQSESHTGGLGSKLDEWHRAGLHPSMASRLRLSSLSPALDALQICDNSPKAHCEWVSPLADITFLSAGTELVLTWDEMYDIALSEPLPLTYTGLPPGLYHLDLKATDAFGAPTPFHQSVTFVIPPPLWTKLWVWAFVLSSAIATLFGIRNHRIHNRFREQLAVANAARLIETERMRIARDIHDDLGARLTQISLISSYPNTDSSKDAGQILSQISLMAKDLIGALHETLWTVNPENDQIDAVSDFICQMAQTLCEAAGIRYRVIAEPLSSACSITSSVRHHLVLAVKEAVNNVIKHGAATQLTLTVCVIENTMTITVCDNGRGFDPHNVTLGYGLKNMEHRMQSVDGFVQITPLEIGGTQVAFSIPLTA